MSDLSSIDDLARWRENIKHDRRNIAWTIMMCGDTGCQASGSLETVDAMKAALVERGVAEIL